jgi:hypothetical protein
VPVHSSGANPGECRPDRCACAPTRFLDAAAYVPLPQPRASGSDRIANLQAGHRDMVSVPCARPIFATAAAFYGDCVVLESELPIFAAF